MTKMVGINTDQNREAQKGPTFGRRIGAETAQAVRKWSEKNKSFAVPHRKNSWERRTLSRPETCESRMSFSAVVASAR
jgi:hypothetical protein